MSAVRVVTPDRRDQLGEGPLWCPRDGTLLWVDILGRSIQRLPIDGGAVETFEQPDHAAWIIEREAGGFIAGIGRDIVTLDLESGARTRIASVDAHAPGNRLNDAKADAAGRLWAGTMPIAKDGPHGGFYRLDPDHRITCVDPGYTIANGPAIHPASGYLLHTDSALRTIFRFDIRDDGSLGKRVLFIAFDAGWGDPDGMTFDAEGWLWVACWSASCVARFTPDGRRDRTIDLPASQITSCVFAGDGLDRMFVTSAACDVNETLGGAVFEVDPGCRGLPASTYRG